MAAQTKRLIIATMEGINHTVEKVTQSGRKRANSPFVVVRGDGTSKPEYVHDPVMTFPEVTLSVAVDKTDAFVASAMLLAEQHRKDPSIATSITIKSFADDGSPQSIVTLFSAVIQEVKLPDGDTGSHTEAMAEIVVQPAYVISSATAT